jgi:hypothetical protein
MLAPDAELVRGRINNQTGEQDAPEKRIAGAVRGAEIRREAMSSFPGGIEWIAIVIARWTLTSGSISTAGSRG